MQPAPSDLRYAAPETRSAQAWLGLALGVLVVAGVFAAMVVIGRMPPFDRFVTDPLFFKRCLVVHVNLALVAWFYSFIAVLLGLLPGRGESGRLARRAPQLAVAGVAGMLVAAALPGARPVLSNYIPMIDHPLFSLGQLVFAAAVLLGVSDRRLWTAAPAEPAVLALPAAARIGLRATAAALWLAALTFAISFAHLPPGVAPEVRFELLVWGGGHVLQLACTLAMLSAWVLLLEPSLGRSPVSGRAAGWLCAALVLPWLSAPLLALAGTWSASYREGFTHFMQWSIFPGVLVFLGLCLRALRGARAAGARAPRLADPGVVAFAVSAALTVLGFALGAAIRGSNTMVPAHYHASIGGVTVAFMAVAYRLLPAFGFPIATRGLRRATAWQPVVYGVGQMVFAAGFGLAGAHGMSRKAYGAEQAARGAAETIGLVVMGVGGFAAIAGGLLFLGLVFVIWRRAPGARAAAAAWRNRWTREIPTASIRSRG
jgi:hypothetical protein